MGRGAGRMNATGRLSLKYQDLWFNLAFGSPDFTSLSLEMQPAAPHGKYDCGISSNT
ncbi:hypothetical protein CDL12_10456 [Handroanthus impetiginosus]|uniref:Uncharacterized protein n=1 Tax=Handroanthus impetiginosus TaxID=429701 RepID=A0A2G9HH65_9LAMI|nr:hypothetical protein CDL12_10456 [Handroanthus impetiginosus]